MRRRVDRPRAEGAACGHDPVGGAVADDLDIAVEIRPHRHQAGTAQRRERLRRWVPVLVVDAGGYHGHARPNGVQ
jgi:hypothetical protein